VNAQSANLGTSTVAQVTGAAATAFTAITAGDLTINGTSVGAIALDGNAANRAASITAAINWVSGTTNVYATVLNSTQVTLTNSSGGNVTIGLAGTATTATTGLTAATTNAATATGFAALDISSVAGADTAIMQMDAALGTYNAAALTAQVQSAINGNVD
jgi:flagellin